jgi:leader peptidase (prepilin peptidase)/N-methyltransferase
MVFDVGFSPAILGWIGFLFGVIFGSFLNVVIVRFPLILEAQWSRDSKEFLGMEAAAEKPFTLATPASHCPHCGTPIKPIHNIPILSYLFLSGRCNQCGQPISPQYPIVELITGLVTAYFLIQFGLSTLSLSSIVFSYALIVLTVIDYRNHLLPDQITLPLLWLGLLVNLQGLFASTDAAIIGAAVGYLSLWSVYWLFKLTTGKEGMGYGDFKLTAALGAWLGWQMVPVVIFLASAVGAVIGCCAIIFAGRDRDTPLAFGPYLCISGWIAMLWGDSILQQYLSFFTL